MKKFFLTIVSACVCVFSKVKFTIIGVVISGFFLVGAIFLANRSFLSYIVSSHWSFGEKALFFWNSLAYFNTGFTFGSQFTIVVTAVLVGINVALAVYYVQEKVAFDRAHGVGVLGIVSAVLGIGCASCGSVILSSIFGVSLSTGLVAILPLHGFEFGLFGIALLVASVYIVSKRIIKPNICKV